MRAGRLRHLVTIEKPVVSRANAYNEPQKTWQTFAANVPAGIEPLRGTERELAGERQAETTVRIVLRWLSGVTPDMRIKDLATGDVYAIVEPPINPDLRDRELVLMCAKGLTND